MFFFLRFPHFLSGSLTCPTQHYDVIVFLQILWKNDEPSIRGVFPRRQDELQPLGGNGRPPAVRQQGQEAQTQPWHGRVPVRNGVHNWRRNRKRTGCRGMGEVRTKFLWQSYLWASDSLPGLEMKTQLRTEHVDYSEALFLPQDQTHIFWHKSITVSFGKQAYVTIIWCSQVLKMFFKCCEEQKDGECLHNKTARS